MQTSGKLKEFIERAATSICDAATVLTHSVEKAHDYGWNYLEIYKADIEGLPQRHPLCAHIVDAIVTILNSYASSQCHA